MIPSTLCNTYFGVIILFDRFSKYFQNSLLKNKMFYYLVIILNSRFQNFLALYLIKMFNTKAYLLENFVFPIAYVWEFSDMISFISFIIIDTHIYALERNKRFHYFEWYCSKYFSICYIYMFLLVERPAATSRKRRHAYQSRALSIRD